VVSTTIGAEGLTVSSPDTIYLADDPAAFAKACLRLLEDDNERRRLAMAGWELVRDSCSWERVVGSFERVLTASEDVRAARKGSPVTVGKST
jgi:glycosyltransferase involved in cell wall biosynthesis